MPLLIDSVGPAAAQGVTTAEISGMVKDAQGGAVVGVSTTSFSPYIW